MGIGGLLSIQENDQDYYYLYDGKGHVTTVLVKAAYDYSPYGVQIAQAGDLDQPYRYSTKRADNETGMIYFGYRFYLPNEGRWLNRDPIEEMGGLNLYQYVSGNPVNYVDPYGLKKGIIAWCLKQLTKGKPKQKPKDPEPEIPEIKEPYKRPNNATTKAQRESVQEKPCVFLW